MVNLFKRFLNISKKEVASNQNSNGPGLTREMILSLDEANKLYDDKKYTEALLKFDLAVKSGIYDDESYTNRGICLQTLDFHLDAIDDFSTAIKLLPYDPNNYFLRSLSLKQIGNYREAVNDNEKAILLSEIPSKENEVKNKKAKGMGYNSATAFYKIRLDLLLQEANFDQAIRDHLTKPKTRRNI